MSTWLFALLHRGCYGLALSFNRDGTKIVLVPSCMVETLRPVTLQHVCGRAMPHMVSLSPG